MNESKTIEICGLWNFSNLPGLFESNAVLVSCHPWETLGITAAKKWRRSTTKIGTFIFILNNTVGSIWITTHEKDGRQQKRQKKKTKEKCQKRSFSLSFDQTDLLSFAYDTQKRTANKGYGGWAKKSLPWMLVKWCIISEIFIRIISTSHTNAENRLWCTTGRPTTEKSITSRSIDGAQLPVR